MLFSDFPIHHKILKNLDNLNINKPTEIQKKSLPIGMLGKDLLASSKTGSGKTFAYLIPAINRLLTQKALSRQDPRAVILAPTRELAKQVFLETKKLVNRAPLKLSLVVGGENYNDQAKILKKNPDIIIGTTGRIVDHLEDKHFFLHGIELLILDEADRMLELGFRDQLNMINQAANHRKRQTMMFSATIDSAAIHEMTMELLDAPETIIVDEQHHKHEDISQSFYYSDGVKHKDALLIKTLLLQNRQQALIFTATREDTNRLKEYLLNHTDFVIEALHGDLLQNQRTQVINKFTRGKTDVLVTTDLAARGLDLINVSLVINYDMPKHSDEYIHRIGRTGRAGNKGFALSFISKKDWASFKAVKATLSQSFKFSAIQGLEAKFSGLTGNKNKVKQSKPEKNTQHDRKRANMDTPSKTNRVKKLKTAGKESLASVELGFVPIKRKVRKLNPSEQTNDNDEHS